MNAKLDGKNLVITIPVNGLKVKDLPKSKSGKTSIVASSGGNMPTAVNIDGKPVIVGLNAYVK